MTPSLLDQCTTGAFDGSVPFPEIIARAAADGVEWYSADLILGMKTYYASDLSHYQSPWPDWTAAKIADPFCAASVEAAIRSSQRKEISYATFLKRIADAGVVYYTVHLKGRKAVYFGRHGDSFVEPFPKAERQRPES